MAYRKKGKEAEAIQDFQKANQLDPTVISGEKITEIKKGTEEKIKEIKKETKEIKKETKEIKKETKEIKKETKEVQDFQSILKELKTEHEAEEEVWFSRSIWSFVAVLASLSLLIFYLKTDYKNLYPLYIFLSVITFIIIRQYTNAKKLRIEASNRLAMVKMFEKIQQTKDNQHYQDFIPKIIESIAYSMYKKNTEATVII